MKNLFAFLILTFTLTSCGVRMEKDDRISRRKDFVNKFSRREIVAEQNEHLWTNYLILRKNKTVVYKSKIFPFLTATYETGKYSIKNDTLNLYFKDNNRTLVFNNDGKSLNWNGVMFKVVKKTAHNSGFAP